MSTTQTIPSPNDGSRPASRDERVGAGVLDAACAPNPEVVAYYDRIAHCYDADRFDNSYGRSIDAQERRILGRWLAPVRGGRVLDLGCGSGRFLDLATHGLDPSEAMVRVARERFPDRDIRVGDVAELAADERGCFDALFCMHVLMHQTPEAVAGMLASAAQLLRPGGRLIFDLPSATRRRLSRTKPAGWHGATALTPAQVAAMLPSQARIIAHRGVLFLPVHRLPESLRRPFRGLDRALSASPVRGLASYVVYCVEVGA